jgi:hypothetical protein
MGFAQSLEERGLSEPPSPPHHDEFRALARRLLFEEAEFLLPVDHRAPRQLRVT